MEAKSTSRLSPSKIPPPDAIIDADHCARGQGRWGKEAKANQFSDVLRNHARSVSGQRQLSQDSIEKRRLTT